MMRTSMLERLNPVAKVLGLILLAIPVTVSVDRVTSGLMLALTALVIAPVSGVSLLAVCSRAWPLVIAAVGGGWAVAVGAEHSGATLARIGWLTISEGSLDSAISMVMRSFSLALPAILVMATTDTAALGDGLAQILRLPQRFVLGAVAALRVVGLMVEDFQTLKLARRARGVGSFGTVADRLRANGGLTFALLVQVVRRGSRMAMTMDARGFSSAPRTWAHESRLGRADWAVMAFCALFSAAAWWAAWQMGTLRIVWS
jgi:energy-coupling factor transport system permease protein